MLCRAECHTSALTAAPSPELGVRACKWEQQADLVSEHGGHPEVRHLQQIVLVQQKILRLDVSVTDSLLVEVFKAGD